MTLLVATRGCAISELTTFEFTTFEFTTISQYFICSTLDNEGLASVPFRKFICGVHAFFHQLIRVEYVWTVPAPCAPVIRKTSQRVY